MAICAWCGKKGIDPGKPHSLLCDALGRAHQDCAPAEVRQAALVLYRWVQQERKALAAL